MNKVKLLLLLSFLVIVFQVSNRCFAAQTIDWSTLNLSEEQLTLVGALDAKWNKLSKDSIPEIDSEQAKLKKLLESANSKSEQIRSANKKVILLENSLQTAAMENFLEKRDILTTDQKKKLLELLAK